MAPLDRCLLRSVGLLILACLVSVTQSTSVVLAQKATLATQATPVHKVIELLKSLATDIEKEGAEEAANYDKYACFNKEQIRTTMMNIDSANKKIAKLTTEIADLNREIAELSGSIGTLGGTITDAQEKIAKLEADRATEKAVFTQKEANLVEGIPYIENAIQSVKDSMSQMKDAKLRLIVHHVDFGAIGKKLLGHLSRRSMPAATVSMLESLANRTTPELKYQFQSHPIIGTLETLITKEKAEITELRQTEFWAQSDFEKEVAALNRDIKFASAEKQEKEQMVAEKTDLVGDKQKSKLQFEEDVAAEQQRKDDITADAEAKASMFDQRSQVRADELHVIANAISILEQQALPNVGGIKKLSFMQTGSARSLLRLRKTESDIRGAPKNLRVGGKGKPSFLNDFVNKVKSSGPSQSNGKPQIFLSAGQTPDPFKRVRERIQGLIRTLEEQQSDEASRKQTCDAVDQITDETPAKIEKLNAQIAATKSDLEVKQTEIQELRDKNAEIVNQISQMEELWHDFDKDNRATVLMCTEGSAAIDSAIQIIQTFYGSVALAQSNKRAIADTTHHTKGVKSSSSQPTYDQETYHGKQDAAKGIIDMLEVIKADFERQKTASEEEWTARDDVHKTEVRDLNADKTRHEGQIEGKETDAQTLSDRIGDYENDLKTQEGLHKDAVEELEALRKMCFSPAEPYEKRVKARREEVKALQDALHTLNQYKD